MCPCDAPIPCQLVEEQIHSGWAEWTEGVEATPLRTYTAKRGARSRTRRLKPSLTSN